MLEEVAIIAAHAKATPPCTEMFLKRQGDFCLMAADSIIDRKGWHVGDWFRLGGDAFVFCEDREFRQGNDHPQNPWKEEPGDFSTVKEKPESIYHENPGYHRRKIEKRNYGSWGKIMEELEELNDAHEQGSKIMQLVELSDLYGAIEGYLQERFPGMQMHDLKKFSDITKRAFKNGDRS